MTMTGPFAGDPERVIKLERPATISHVIERESLVFRLPTIAVLHCKEGAVPVLRKDWPTRKIKRGELLVFVAVPRGGNRGKTVVALIGSLALAIAAPFAGAAIAGAFGFTSALAANIASAAFLVGGSLFLNAVLQAPTDPAQDAEQVYTANASSNRVAPLDVIPVLYGYLRYPPPFAALAYSEFEGNDQILYQLHCLSCGVVEPKRFHIGDTLAWSSNSGFTDAFDGLDLQVVQPGDSLTLFPANVVVSGSVSGQTVPDPPDMLGGFAVNQAGTDISQIAIDFTFPAGLFSVNDDGDTETGVRELLADYQEIDDNGDPVGSWINFLDKRYERRSRTPLRFTVRADVAPGRYQVRFYSTNTDATDKGKFFNRVLWVGLRGYLTNWDLPSNVTLVATRIRASEQLSQVSANQYHFTAQRLLPIYDPDTQSWGGPQETNSIAWAVADILRNPDYGFGLADTLFDLDWLAAYDDVWSQRDDEFNAVFDRRWTGTDAVNATLRAGRAQSVRLGGKIGFVRSEPKQVKRHVFTPRNIVVGSFSRRFVLFDEEAPDHVVARYLDRDSWQEREVSAVISAVGEAEHQEKDYFGVTSRDQAWREAIFDAACNAYCRDFVSFETEWEGKLLVRGDPILVHGPLIRNVQVAALYDRDGDTLTIDRDFEPEVGTTYFVILRGKDGGEWGPALVDSFTDLRTIELDAVSRLAAEAQYGVLSTIIPGSTSEPAHVLICKEESRPFDGILVSAIPDGPHRVTVVAVKDDQRIHLADQTEIIPAPYTPPSLFTPAPEAPSIDASSLYAVARNGTVHIELEAGWQPAPGAQRYVAEISYDDDAATSPSDASWTPVHDSVGTRFTTVILAEAWTLRVAAVGARQGLWSYVSGTSPEPVLPPKIVTEASLNSLLDVLLDQLREDRQAFLSGVIDDLRGEIETLAQANNGQYAVVENLINTIVTSVGQRVGDNEASVTTLTQAVADDQSALATLFVDLLAKNLDGEAQGLIRFIAAALPEGAVASFAVEVRAEYEDDFQSAGIFLDVGSFADGGTSRIRLRADNTNLEDNFGNVRQLMAAVIAGDPNSAPVSSGVIKADLRQNIPVSTTFLDDDAEVQFPLGGRLGFPFWHVFTQDGTGGRVVTFDHAAITAPAPTVDTTANVTTILMGLVYSTNPPRMTYAPFGDPGQTTSDSHTIFALTPAYNGISVWNTAIDGPLDIDGPYTGTITPLGDDLQCDVELWGAGGTGGSAGSSGGTSNPSAGTASTFQGMTANPGGFGASNDSIDIGGGAGGTASGGDTNVGGGNGGGGEELDGGGAHGGGGGVSPFGGAGVPGITIGAGAEAEGVDGNAPGGGARGGAWGDHNPRSEKAGAGGGGGGYSKKTFGASVLLKDTSYALVVGDSGATGTLLSWGVKGGKGAPGRARIS